MGPKWIVLVVRGDGETSAEVFDTQDAAQAAYDVCRKTPGRVVYLAAESSEAHT